MNEFLHFYRWGMGMKLHMSIYTLALVFVKSVVNLLSGVDTVSVWTMLQMVLVCLAWAVLESLLFPQDRELERTVLRRRTAVWALCGNALLAGGALAFRWFAGVPAWGAAVLVAVLELGLLAMWVGIHVVQRRDTRALNANLRQYQSGQ